MIILDNHFSGARRCPGDHPDSRCPSNVDSAAESAATTNGGWAWLDSGYTETQWIADWVTLAKRYGPGQECGNVSCGSQPTVIGFDLHNEPHTVYGGHAYNLNDYLKRGSTWGPYPNGQHPDPRWSPKSDWAAGADAAGSAVLTVNPNLLIFVEGVQLYPDKSQPHGVEVYSWGGILRGVVNDPIEFTNTDTGKPITNQLVYSPHEWGKWKDNLGQFSYRTSFASLKKIFNENWAFILNAPSNIQAPIWLGEFNTCNYSLKCVTSETAKCLKKHLLPTQCQPGSQGQWFQIMLQYLTANPEIGWSYYSLNGTNWLNEPENNSILGKYWVSEKLPSLVQDLQSLPTPLTVTASSATISYGQQIPATQPSYVGLTGGETAPRVSPVCKAAALQQSGVGA